MVRVRGVVAALVSFLAAATLAGLAGLVGLAEAQPAQATPSAAPVAPAPPATANAGVRWKDIELGVDIQNLFNATWREVNFASDTRLAYEPATVTGIHYSPGWPFTAIGRATLYWR